MLSRTLLPVVGLLLSALSSRAQGDNSVYTGCVSMLPTGAVPNAGTTDPDTCIAACASGGSTYAYYAAGDEASAIAPDCECSSSAVSADYYQEGASSQGGCAAAQFYSVYFIGSSFSFGSCYGLVPDGAAAIAGNSPLDCFTQCASSAAVYIVPVATAGSEAAYYQCNCRTAVTEATTATCNPGVALAFTHPAAAAASGLYRRSLREQLRLAQLDKGPCPGSLLACLVDGVQDGYECIDTQSELESCGGCMRGVFGQHDGNLTVGTDCSAMEGAMLGATTCIDGRCQAMACMSGFELVNGQCA